MSEVPKADLVESRDNSRDPIYPRDDEFINKDERAICDWKSRYDSRALVHICMDACIVGVVLMVTLTALLLTWKGSLYSWIAFDCPSCARSTFDRYAYLYLGGLLGGTLYSIKYLYKVVARGFWNIDRRLWRIFSPLLSGGLALAVGALIESGFLGLTTKTSSASTYFSIGFITGYFADSALWKMQEVADTIFGSPERHAQAMKAAQAK